MLQRPAPWSTPTSRTIIYGRKKAHGKTGLRWAKLSATTSINPRRRRFRRIIAPPPVPDRSGGTRKARLRAWPVLALAGDFKAVRKVWHAVRHGVLELWGLSLLRNPRPPRSVVYIMHGEERKQEKSNSSVSSSSSCFSSRPTPSFHIPVSVCLTNDRSSISCISRVSFESCSRLRRESL